MTYGLVDAAAEAICVQVAETPAAAEAPAKRAPLDPGAFPAPRASAASAPHPAAPGAERRRHAGDILPRANYNDEADPAVAETVAKLVDVTRVVELERIDPDALPERRLYRLVKRAFDIASCSCALLVCAIPMAVIAALIKLDSPGPVLYRQERLGLNGRPITIVKFRSMYVGAEERGAQWAGGDDPRVTPIGKRLRASRLDELPQFWSVVKGDLSLIGPRPEREVFCDEFEKYINGFSQRMMVKPGITGLAQVNGGYDLLPEEKVLYDLEYVKHRSIAMDWRIIWKTLRVLFTHEGAR